jgi:hypothetical protein
VLLDFLRQCETIGAQAFCVMLYQLHRWRTQSG